MKSQDYKENKMSWTKMKNGIVNVKFSAHGLVFGVCPATVPTATKY
jgi:hypothetical protein